MDSLRIDKFGREQEASLKGPDKNFALYMGVNTIGRNKEAVINIKSLSVSQHHALIIIKNETFYISDLNSCNGTTLNNVKLSPFLLYELNNEAKLQFGEYVAYFTSEKEFKNNTNNMTQEYSQTFYSNDTQLLHNTHALMQTENTREVQLNKTNKQNIFGLSNTQGNIDEQATQVVNLEEFELSTCIPQIKNKEIYENVSCNNIKDNPQKSGIISTTKHAVPSKSNSVPSTSNTKNTLNDDSIQEKVLSVPVTDIESKPSTSMPTSDKQEENVSNKKVLNSESDDENIHDAPTQVMEFPKNYFESLPKFDKQPKNIVGVNKRVLNRDNDEENIQDAPIQVMEFPTNDNNSLPNSGKQDKKITETTKNALSNNSDDENINDAPTQVMEFPKNYYTSLPKSDNQEHITDEANTDALNSNSNEENINDAPKQIIELPINNSNEKTSKSHKQEENIVGANQVLNSNNGEDNVHDAPTEVIETSNHYSSETVTQDVDFTRFINEDNYEEQPTVDKSSDIHEIETEVFQYPDHIKVFSAPPKDKSNIESTSVPEKEQRVENEKEEDNLTSDTIKICSDSMQIPKSDSRIQNDVINESSNDSVDFLTIDKVQTKNVNKKKSVTSNLHKPGTNIQNSDDETDIEDNVSSKSAAKSNVLGEDSDTDIESTERATKEHKISQKQNMETGIEQTKDDSVNSSPLIKQTKKKCGGLIESSDSETDIEDHENIKFKRKQIRMLVSQDNDSTDSEEEIVKIKRKSVYLLSSQEEEGSDKENMNARSFTNTTIPDTPTELNNSENLDDTDCIPATQEFNAITKSNPIKIGKVDNSSRETKHFSDNLDDTDCIPATQDILEIKPQHTLNIQKDDNSNDSSESFKLGLTEMMISQNNNPTNSSQLSIKQSQTNKLSQNKAGSVNYKSNKPAEVIAADASHKTMSDDEETDLSKSFNLQLMETSDVCEKTTEIISTNNQITPNENEEDIYFQPTQQVSQGSPRALPPENIEDNSIYLKPTQKLMFKTPTVDHNISKDDEIYFEPTQKLTSTIANIENKSFNDTDEIYLQPTQKLQSAITNIEEKILDNVEDENIYLQSTQKLDTESENSKTLENTVSENKNAKSSYTNKKKKFVFKKNNLNMNSSLSDTLPSVVSDSIFDVPTEKHTDTACIETVETMSQIAAFVHDSGESAQVDSKTSKLVAKIGEKMTFATREKINIFDMPTQEAGPSNSPSKIDERISHATKQDSKVCDVPTQKPKTTMLASKIDEKILNATKEKINIFDLPTQQIEKNKLASEIDEEMSNATKKKTDIFEVTTQEADPTKLPKINEEMLSATTKEMNIFDVPTQDATSTVDYENNIETMSQIEAFVNNIPEVNSSKRSRNNKIKCINTKASESFKAENNSRTRKHRNTQNTVEIKADSGTPTPAKRARRSAIKNDEIHSNTSIVNDSKPSTCSSSVLIKVNATPQMNVSPIIDEESIPQNSNTKSKLTRKTKQTPKPNIHLEKNEDLTQSNVKIQPECPSESRVEKLKTPVIRKTKRNSEALDENKQINVFKNQPGESNVGKLKTPVIRKTRRNSEVLEENKQIKVNKKLSKPEEINTSLQKSVDTVTLEVTKTLTRSTRKTSEIKLGTSKDKQEISTESSKLDDSKAVRSSKRKGTTSIVPEEKDTILKAPTQSIGRATRKRRTSAASENEFVELNKTKEISLNNTSKLEVNQSFALLEAKTTRTRKIKKDEEVDIQIKVPDKPKTQKDLKEITEIASTSSTTRKTKKVEEFNKQVKDPDKTQIDLKDIRETASTSHTSRKTKKVESAKLSTSSSSSTCSTPKRQRLADATLISPSDRSKRKQRHKVVFTMLDNPQLESMVKQLGGSIVDSVDTCTVLVTKAVKRSQKLLQAVGQSKPICSPKWIEDSKKKHEFLDPWDYILIDKEAEDKWNFSLKESLHKSSDRKMLQDHSFQLVVTQAAEVLKGAIESCGGKCVTKHPGKGSENFFIVTTPEHKTKYSKIKKQHPEVTIIQPEAIFDGVLRQELRFEDHIVA